MTEPIRRPGTSSWRRPIASIAISRIGDARRIRYRDPLPVKEGSILSNDSRSSEKFMHGIKVLMAKNYIDNLSEETRKGMLEKSSSRAFGRPTHLIGYTRKCRRANREYPGPI